jgi:hypothetical protein
MPRKPIDLPAKFAEILDHVGDMPPEAEAPISHCRAGITRAVRVRRSSISDPLDRAVARSSQEIGVAGRPPDRTA